MHDLVRITAKEARRFLSELANLSNEEKALVRFEKFFGDILPKEARRIPFYELTKANPGLIGLIDEIIGQSHLGIRAPIRPPKDLARHRSKN